MVESALRATLTVRMLSVRQSYVADKSNKISIFFTHFVKNMVLLWSKYDSLTVLIWSSFDIIVAISTN